MMKFIDYKTLRDFYTISELCELFEMPKEDLRTQCEIHSINPVRNEIGDAGLTKYDVRRLHNTLYYENRERQKEWDPWA